jgi:Mrp family chromosome partitioning ATPase
VGEIADLLRRVRRERDPDGKVEDAEWAALAESADPLAAFDPPGAPDSLPGWNEAPSARVTRTGQAGLVRIPTTRRGRWAARAVVADHEGRYSEHYRHFALRVRRALEQRKARSVLVTSPLPEEGKTNTACNLALALASMAAGKRIALVELDLRRPSIAKALGLSSEAGFENVLAGRVSFRSGFVRCAEPDLDLYLVRNPSERAHELLAGLPVRKVLRELAAQYDTVVIDTPPVLPVPDVPLVAPHVDACVVVVEAGATRRSAFRDALQALPRDKVIGVFVNKSRSARHVPAEHYVRHATEEVEET